MDIARQIPPRHACLATALEGLGDGRLSREPRKADAAFEQEPKLDTNFTGPYCQIVGHTITPL